MAKKLSPKLDRAKKKQVPTTDDLLWSIGMSLLLISAADGQLEESELRVLCASMLAIDPKLTPQKVETVLKENQKFIITNKNLQTCLDAIAKKTTSQEQKAFVTAISAAAMFSDGEVDQNERALYYAIANKLGFDPKQADTIVREILS